MKIILKTHRLVLREFMKDDLPELYRMNSNPEIMQYVGDGKNRVKACRFQIPIQLPAGILRNAS